MIKQILQDYGHNKRVLEAKKQMLEQLKDKRNNANRDVGISSYDYERLPSNNMNKPNSLVEHIAIKYLDLELSLEKQIYELEYEILYVDTMLTELNEVWYNIVIYKFVEELTWEQVAYKLNLSISACRYQFQMALTLLEEQNFSTSLAVDAHILASKN